MGLAFLDKYKYTDSTDFGNKVIEISQDLGINPNYLMLAMWHESGLKTTAVNPYTNATGLIQFMPSTATSLGTTVNDLLQMNGIEQLQYVKKYFQNVISYYGVPTTLEDVYLAIFFPLAIPKNSDYILKLKNVSSATIARQNPVFDVGNKGYITKGDIEKVIQTWIPNSEKKYFEFAGGGLIILALGISLLYFLSKKK